MAEQKENSVLFSLRELMNLEQERVRQEEEDKRRRDEDSRQRRNEEIRRARAEEESRIRAAEQARLAEEARLRAKEESDRRAREEAELRVRFEAEATARRDEQERLLAHERRLAEIAAQQKRGVGAGAVMAVLLGVMGVAGAGLYFGVITPARERARREEQLVDQQLARANADANAARAEAERLRHMPPPSTPAIVVPPVQTQPAVTPQPAPARPQRPHRPPRHNNQNPLTTDPSNEIPGIGDL